MPKYTVIVLYLDKIFVILILLLFSFQLTVYYVMLVRWSDIVKCVPIGIAATMNLYYNCIIIV